MLWVTVWWQLIASYSQSPSVASDWSKNAANQLTSGFFVLIRVELWLHTHSKVPLNSFKALFVPAEGESRQAFAAKWRHITQQTMCSTANSQAEWMRERDCEWTRTMWHDVAREAGNRSRGCCWRWCWHCCCCCCCICPIVGPLCSVDVAVAVAVGARRLLTAAWRLASALLTLGAGVGAGCGLFEDDDDDECQQVAVQHRLRQRSLAPRWGQRSSETGIYNKSDSRILVPEAEVRTRTQTVTVEPTVNCATFLKSFL